LNTRELLFRLAKLEDGLDTFSFTELNTKEARRLKESFEFFKNGLEAKVFGESSPIDFLNQNKGKVTDETVLVSNMRHQINTPLQGVLGLVDLLKDTDLDTEQTKLVSALEIHSRTLAEIISGLLDYSKIASGKETFEKVPFNLHNLVNEVTFLCQTLITKANVNLTVTLNETVPKQLIGDPMRLSQVLLNLMGHAIKRVDQGEISLDITGTVVKNNTVYLQFVIRRTASIESEGKLGNILQTYRTALSGNHAQDDGADLDLEIIKVLVEKQQGCFSASHDLELGTTFKVILPFMMKVLEAHDNTIETHSAFKGAKVLVFEDDALTQRLMKNRLDKWDCKSYITGSANDGLRYLENYAMDVVLIDIGMPGINGFEIAKRIRKSGPLPSRSVPIILASSDFERMDLDKCEALGIDDFIVKPYNTTELNQKIAQLIKSEQGQSGEVFPSAHETRKKQQAHKPMVDLAPLKEECQGQTKLLKELVRLFKQNALEFIGAVKIHLQGGNLQGVGFAADKIKPCLKMVHANTLLKIVEQIVMECGSNNEDLINRLYLQFVEEYPLVEMAIDKAMKH